MISSLKIRYFQKHKNLDLEFTPGVNVIKGKTDTGKSAVIRALRWVLENRPSGIKFKTKRVAPTTSVSVELEINDETIIRTKSNSRNEYFFRGETYKAMGNDVPEPILEFTNVTALNIQRQLDEHFLFQYPDSKVSKMINDASGMEEIVGALEETNRRVRRSAEQERVLVDLIDEKEVQINKIIKYQKHEEAVSSIKKKIARLEKKEEKLEKLRKILVQAKKIQDEKLHKNILSKIMERHPKLASAEVSLARKNTELQKLERLINSYRKLHSEPTFDFTKVDAKVKSIQTKMKSLAEKTDSVYFMEKKISSTQNLMKGIEENDELLKESISDLEKLKNKMGVCPTCNKEW